MRSRKTNVLYEEVPEWTEDFADVALGGGITILGARSAEAAQPKSGFVSEVVLRVDGPVEGTWNAELKGERRGGGDSFIWRHAVSDGGWDTSQWEKGEIGADLTLARPPEMEEGIYDLSWRLRETESRKVIRPKDPKDADEHGFVPVGEIRIARAGVPRGAAGVTWSGRLSEEDEAGDAPTRTLLPWLVGGGSALVVVALVAAVLLVRSRRRRAA
jgi:hypothetical protein